MEENLPTPWKLRFWTIFMGQAISLIGSAITQFALVWWITDTTGSVTNLGIAGLAAMLPQALCGPLAGVFADRHNRQFIMVLADTVSAWCMTVLIVLFMTDRIELWHIYVLMAVRSAMQAFQQPAMAASISMLVPASFLSQAAGLNQTVAGLVLIGAAPLGALAMSMAPIGWVLSIDVLTAVLGVMPLLILSVPQEQTQSSSGKLGYWRDFRTGLSSIWDNLMLRHLYTLITIAMLVIMPMSTMVPLLVKAHFGGGASEVALLESLAGVGMIVGGVLLSIIAPKKRLPWVLLGLATACLCVALCAWVPGNLFWAALCFWLLCMIANSMSNASLMALIQGSVPNALQGRAISILTTLMAMTSPVGLGIATPLGEFIGVRWLFVVLGSTGAIIMLMGFLSRELRHADKSGAATENLSPSGASNG